MTGRGTSLTEPIVVSEFWANRSGKSVRVQLHKYEGCTLVDVRKHFTADDGKMQPTKKGLSIAVARLPDLAKAINHAVDKARELGLIADKGRGND